MFVNGRLRMRRRFMPSNACFEEIESRRCDRPEREGRFLAAGTRAMMRPLER
jgi:hypothetical protein